MRDPTDDPVSNWAPGPLRPWTVTKLGQKSLDAEKSLCSKTLVNLAIAAYSVSRLTKTQIGLNRNIAAGHLRKTAS